MVDISQLTHNEAELVQRCLELTQSVAGDARKRHEDITGGPDIYSHLFGAIEQCMGIMMESLNPLLKATEPPKEEVFH